MLCTQVSNFFLIIIAKDKVMVCTMNTVPKRSTCLCVISIRSIEQTLFDSLVAHLNLMYIHDTCII